MPVLTLYSVAALKISLSINTISLMFSSLKFNRSLFDEIFRDIKINSNFNLKNSHSSNNKTNENYINFQDKIVLNDLSFGYKDSDKKLFDRLNLEIKNNQILV